VSSACEYGGPHVRRKRRHCAVDVLARAVDVGRQTNPACPYRRPDPFLGKAFAHRVGVVDGYDDDVARR
jgi:hypothetical protein